MEGGWYWNVIILDPSVTDPFFFNLLSLCVYVSSATIIVKLKIEQRLTASSLCYETKFPLWNVLKFFLMCWVIKPCHERVFLMVLTLFSTLERGWRWWTSRSTVRNIFRKLMKFSRRPRHACAKMIQKNLTQQQKDKRTNICYDIMERSTEESDLLTNAISWDETWILHYDPLSVYWWTGKLHIFKINKSKNKQV